MQRLSRNGNPLKALGFRKAIDQMRLLAWGFVIWCVVFLSAAILEYSVRG